MPARVRLRSACERSPEINEFAGQWRNELLIGKRGIVTKGSEDRGVPQMKITCMDEVHGLFKGCYG
jgi:hypothetical protein